MQVDQLINLIVKQIKHFLKPQVIRNLPEDLQDIIRRNLSHDEQIELFYGLTKTWYSHTATIQSIRHYQPYYTLGEVWEFFENGHPSSHSYYYNGKKCWISRSWHPNGQLEASETFDKYGKFNGSVKQYDKTGQLIVKGEVYGYFGHMTRWKSLQEKGTDEPWKTDYDVFVDYICNEFVAHGKCISYQKNGEIRHKGQFCMDTRVGTWYHDGQEIEYTSHDKSCEHCKDIELKKNLKKNKIHIFTDVIKKIE